MFDALLRAGRLRPREIEDLRFFGVAGALVLSDDSAVRSTADDVRAGWEEVVRAVRRLRQGGVAAWAAVGVHPARIPLRGLEALLAELPDALGRREVTALGLVGLWDGGELEERVLGRQLELARELRLPVVVEAGRRGGDRAVRRLLAVVRESEVEPDRVLVAGADSRTVRTIRACGHVSALRLSGDGSRDEIDAAVAVVRALGPEGIVLGSDAGMSGGDLLALARAADRLERTGLSVAVVRRVCGENAVAFLRVDPVGVGVGDRGRRGRR